VYGNDSEFGLGVTNLYHHQGTERVATIVQHLQQDSFTGKLLRTSIEAAKIEIGSEQNIFQLPFATYSPFLTDCWIKDVWRYTREQNIHIDDQVTYSLSGNSPDDPFIMDVCVTLGFKGNSLLEINRCRLYLQVLTLEDIRALNSLDLNEAYKVKNNTTSFLGYSGQYNPDHLNLASKCGDKLFGESERNILTFLSTFLLQGNKHGYGIMIQTWLPCIKNLVTHGESG